MKKVVIALMGALVLGSALSFVEAKDLTVKEIVEKTAKKEKTDKLGKAEAKRQRKAGWVVMEGSLPMEKQYAESYAYELAVDDNERPYFYQGKGEYTSSNKGTAYKFACQAAAMDLASTIEQSLAGATETTTDDVNGEASTTGSQSVKSLVAAKLNGLQPVVKIYKKEGNKYSVIVNMFYSRSQADVLAAKARAEALKHDKTLDNDVEKLLEKVAN